MMYKINAIKIIRNSGTKSEAALKLIGNGCDAIETNHYLAIYENQLGKQKEIVNWLNGGCNV